MLLNGRVGNKESYMVQVEGSLMKTMQALGYDGDT
jgi:hypothetical protein